MIRTLLIGSAAAALLAACGTPETRTVYYDAPAPTYTSGYYIAPVVTVREPRLLQLPLAGLLRFLRRVAHRTHDVLTRLRLHAGRASRCDARFAFKPPCASVSAVLSSALALCARSPAAAPASAPMLRRSASIRSTTLLSSSCEGFSARTGFWPLRLRFDQREHRILVAIDELRRREVALLLLDDLVGDVEHGAGRLGTVGIVMRSSGVRAPRHGRAAWSAG